MQKWEHDTPARDAQEGKLKVNKEWAPPKLVAPERRVTSVGRGEAVKPAAAFACERLREAELAWTRVAAYCLFLHTIPLWLSAKTLCPIPTGVRRLSTLLLGPMESGSEAGFPWEKAEQRSGLHLPLAEDCSPRSL